MIGVVVSPPSATLRPGDSLQASATFGCAGEHASVRWSSSNTTIATVDSVSGLVRALSAPGTASIIASLAADRAMNGAMALQTIH